MRKDLGEYIVVLIKGDVNLYIGKIIRENPLRLKIQEMGELSVVDIDNCHIQTTLTEKLQGVGCAQFLSDCKKRGTVLYSGLTMLGGEKGEIRKVT